MLRGLFGFPNQRKTVQIFTRYKAALNFALHVRVRVRIRASFTAAIRETIGDVLRQFARFVFVANQRGASCCQRISNQSQELQLQANKRDAGTRARPGEEFLMMRAADGLTCEQLKIYLYKTLINTK